MNKMYLLIYKQDCNKCIMLRNNLVYASDIRNVNSFSSSQMTSIKTYLTAVYHAQLHFRCKWGLLSIIHRHHYALHTVWHLTQVVTAQRHQWLVTGLHMRDADITTYVHLSSTLIIHAVQKSMPLHPKRLFFSFTACVQFQYTLLWLIIGLSPGSRVLLSQSSFLSEHKQI